MNKKGQQFLFVLGIMLAIAVFVGGIVMIEPTRVQIDQVRTDLSCGGANITIYTDMTCIVVGSMLPLFALAVVGSALAVIGIKKSLDR